MSDDHYGAFDTDQDVERGMAAGSSSATSEWHRRENRRMMAEGGGAVPHVPIDGPPIGLFVAIAIPLFTVYFVVKGLSAGAVSLANDSLLAPLFPRFGDSTFSFVVQLVILMALIPGGLILSGELLRRTRFAVVSLVLYPLAFILVPTIALVTVNTTGKL